MASEIISVDHRVLAGFRRRAWRVFPKEHIEVVIGRGTEIHAIHPLEYRSTSEMCAFDEEQLAIVAQQVHPLQVLGTIHTHPGCDTCEPSEGDWLALRQTPERITGICSLWEKNGRRRSRIRFFRATAPFHLDVR